MTNSESMIQTREDILSSIRTATNEVKAIDMHTHLFAPEFGSLLLWGIDEILTYHYLISEAFRWIDMPYERFWALPKSKQADIVWQTLFVERTPISESCRGVVTILKELGLDPKSRTLEPYRDFFRSQNVESYVEQIINKANIDWLVMTNDPFDDLERTVWDTTGLKHPKFRAALRLDAMLNDWNSACKRMSDWGYKVDESLGDTTFAEIRRFMREWCSKMDALYLAVSLPPDFEYPEASPRAVMLSQSVLPMAEEMNLPVGLMIGVRRGVNPNLGLAGDALSRASMLPIERLCSEHPNVRFLVTMLSRENQHEFCVTARKFRNLTPFGCWWFLNTQHMVKEITKMRFELLGTSFIPQHSDARVLEQIIYKWAYSREIIANTLADYYEALIAANHKITYADIKRDIEDLYRNNFLRQVK